MVDGKPENLVGMNGTSNSLNFKTSVDGFHGFTYLDLPFSLINIGRLCLLTNNRDNDAWEDLVWENEFNYRENESPMPLFDESARQVWQTLKLPLPPNNDKEELKAMPSCLWEHPTTGGKFFIGSQAAAMDKELLEKLGIFSIIYAKTPTKSQLHHENDERFKYM